MKLLRWSTLMILILATTAFGEDVETSLDQLKANLPKLERSLNNLYVESHCLTEQWDDAKAAWERVNETDLTAWYDGEPNGRVRLDYHPRIIRWIGGAAPFSESNWSITYNGTYGQERYIQMDKDGTLLEPGSGQLFCTRPTQLVDMGRYESGLALTFLAQQKFSGQSITDLFRFSSTGRFRFVVDRADCDGVPCIRAVFEALGVPIHRWFIDPKRGYALRLYEHWEGATLTERIAVQEYLEAAPGIFYPKRATREMFRAAGAPFVRSTLKVSKAVINDPAFDYKIFDFKWQAGSSVYEGRTKSSVPLTGDFEKDNALLLAAAQKAARAPATGPAR